jgi:hypothetical protein
MTPPPADHFFSFLGAGLAAFFGVLQAIVIYLRKNVA